MIWQSNKIFKQPFVNIGEWNLNFYKSFPHCDFLSADTETKLYLNEELLTEEKAFELYKNNGAKWCRMNIKVNAYAYMISDGKNFALFQNIEDFLLCCSMMLVKRIFWYNAKFDFSLFDYFFETHYWKTSEEQILLYGHERKKLPNETYQSLNGDFGQRYQLRIWYEYKNRSGNYKVHNFKMVDICNIYGGGLRKNLEDWKIVDKNNSEVRKLEMDYVNASVENDLQYMINDTKGLHLLAEKIDKTIKEISGFSLFNGDYITAGGLAKKSFLKFMFNCEKTSENLKLFRDFFPLTIEEDEEFRKRKLYQGGKCFVSPYKIGKIQKKIYKFDINSMYPTQMRNMLYPVGKPNKVDDISDDKTKIYILKIKNIYGKLRENMVPVWYDTLTGDYKDEFFEQEEKYYWLDELEELQNYYFMDFKVLEILEYDGYYSDGAKKYVDNYYEIKKNSKGAIRNGAKLFLNSAYGKIAQKIERVNCEYRLSDEGYIHLVKLEEEIDENAMMSVVVGSRITALSRVLLMQYIRKICKNNPKKYFIYCDTDSVHALCDYKDTDENELGKMKSEGVYEYGKYLAPKTYLLFNNLEKNDNEYEVHCKGVNTNVVLNEMNKCKNFNEASEKFKSGVNYRCLTSLNCIGGKALIYIDKMLLNPKLEKKIIEEDEVID